MNKKGKVLRVIAILILIAGVAVLLYPHIINYFYDTQTSRKQAEYFVQAETNSRLDALYERLRAENTALYESGQAELKDPFSYAQPSVDLSEYGIDDNCIGYIIIEKMDVLLPIYLGANNLNLANGAAHMTQTSYPIGGENTNAIIAGHRGSRVAMFRNIDRLEIGDTVVIQNFREELTYTVCEIKIISPTDVGELLIQEGRDLVTLISCHPYGVNNMRYIVYCERR